MDGVLKLKREISELLGKRKRCGNRGLEHCGYMKVTRTHTTSIAGQLIDIDVIKSVS